jgi:predicted hotdog family 3-hydroxylacyl-ACP dehydratase
LLIDSVEEYSPSGALATARLRESTPYACDDGTLEPIAYVEMMAQCFAACAGLAARRAGLPVSSWGYLAALKRVIIHAPSRVGDTLHIRAGIGASLGEITVVRAEVRNRNALVAEGEFKIFVPKEES